MAFVSITRLRIRSSHYLFSFMVWSLLCWFQAKRAPGCLRVKLLRDANRTFWTATSWQDEASMKAYRINGFHRRAMPKLLDWCDEASIVHWTQESTELPTWEEAHRRMAEEGRRSKVNHPSQSHEAYEISEPKV